MTLIFFAIVAELLVSAAIDYQLRGTLKLGSRHYIALIIGPVTLLITFHSHIQKLEYALIYPLSSRFYLLLLIFFMAVGYIAGWLEIGLFKLILKWTRNK